MSEKALTEAQLRFLDRFEKGEGHISDACKAAKVGRKTYYDWLAASETFAEAVEEAEQAIYDHAEKCWGRAAKKDWKAAQALLERRRAKRFSARVIEQENGAGTTNEPLPVVILDPQTKLAKPLK